MTGTCLLLPLTFGACDSAATPEYAGEPLATLHGSLQSSMAEPPDEANAMLVWAVTAGSPDLIAGTQAVVKGEFPASFTLELLEPPPAEALNDFTSGGQDPDEGQIGVAYITVVGPDFDIANQSEDGVLGVASGFVVAYVAEDLKPGSWSAEAFGGALKKGYHVLAVEPQDEAGDEPSFDLLVPAPEGFETDIQIELVDDPDGLEWPNWT